MPTALEDRESESLPDHYEVVNGEIVEVTPMSGFSSEVANRIRDQLAAYALSRRTGRTRSDMQFLLPLPGDPKRSYIPDAAFISFDRWPEDRPMRYRGNPVDVVPELVVEAASPTDKAEAVLEKAHAYLRAGALLVWVVFPRLRQVYAYTHPGTPPRIFTDGETLDAGDVLPGFAVPMGGLFPTLVAETDATDDD